jgi:hypothetical protein
MDYEASAGGVLMPSQGLRIGGIFHGQIIRNGEVVEEFDDSNIVVDQGLNHVLNVEFNGLTPVNPWYLGLFEGNYTPVAAVTAAGIAAAATECVAYSQATRPSFVNVASTAKSITNSASTATFTFVDARTLYGAILISDSTKGGTAGVLFSAAKFATPKVMGNTDQLLLTYTFTAATV